MTVHDAVSVSLSWDAGALARPDLGRPADPRPWGPAAWLRLLLLGAWVGPFVAVLIALAIGGLLSEPLAISLVFAAIAEVAVVVMLRTWGRWGSRRRAR